MIERWRAASPFARDCVLAAVCLVVTVGTIMATSSVHDDDHLRAAGLVLIVGQTLPVAFRRRWTVAAWLVAGAATATYGIGNFPDTVLDLGPLLVIYTVASETSRRTATALGVTTLVCMVAALVTAGDADAKDFSFNILVYAVAWIVGESQRSRRAYTRELEEKAARLEREREEEAQRAVVGERARIARELHDVVAHHVSMMVVQAEGGASVVATAPERAAEAFDAISGAGRQAMTEMRRVLGVLGDPETGGDGAQARRTPQPGLDGLDGLVEGVRQAGLAVVLRREGEPRPLPPGLDLSAYRIVQEALTNTVRHARAGRATVVVRYVEAGVELEVTDDGVGPGGASTNGGHGLVGMRERVALFGGELTAGPGADGGFAVIARLPVVPPP